MKLVLFALTFMSVVSAQANRCTPKDEISEHMTKDVIEIRTRGDIVPNDIEAWYLSTNYLELGDKWDRDIFIEGYVRPPNEYIVVLPVLGYGADFDEKDLLYFCLDMPYGQSGELVVRFLQSGSLGRREGSSAAGGITDFFHRAINGPAAEFRSKRLDFQPANGVTSFLDRLKPFIPVLPDLIAGTINVSQAILNEVGHTVIGAQVRKVVFTKEKISFDIEAGGALGMNANVWTYDADIKNPWLSENAKLR